MFQAPLHSFELYLSSFGSSYSAFNSSVKLNRVYCELRLHESFPSSLAQFRTRSIKRDVSSSYSASNSSVKLNRVYFGLKRDVNQKCWLPGHCLLCLGFVLHSPGFVPFEVGCPVIFCCVWDLCPFKRGAWARICPLWSGLPSHYLLCLGFVSVQEGCLVCIIDWFVHAKAEHDEPSNLQKLSGVW